MKHNKFPKNPNIIGAIHNTIIKFRGPTDLVNKFDKNSNLYLSLNSTNNPQVLINTD
jgi:hypothetical protein